MAFAAGRSGTAGSGQRREPCQEIAALARSPPVSRQQLSYAEISARLGRPADSIGPNRSRCLAKMRRYPAIAALINSEEE